MMLMPAGRYFASDYIATFRAAGLTVVDCAEPRWGPGDGAGGPFAQYHCEQAAAAAYFDTPAAIVWHLEKHEMHEKHE